MAILEACDVWKEYREGREVVPVLSGVSLALERGRFAALEGPSGSGKTTLLFILGCLLSPTRGQIRIDGRAVAPGRLGEARRRSIGFVFQHFELFPALDALENVEYAMNLKGWVGAPARREAERLLEAVGLLDRRRARPHELSGGQKQRVAIARALAGRAPILLADEPTASLDHRLGGQVFGLFRDLARSEGRAVLVVTHDPRARDYADEVLRLRDGGLLERGG